MNETIATILRTIEQEPDRTKRLDMMHVFEQTLNKIQDQFEHSHLLTQKEG